MKRKRRSELYIFDCNNSFKEILVFCCMFKRVYNLLKIFTKYYKVTSYHNPEPDFYLKVGFFGKIKKIPKHGYSRLEKATQEEICEGLEEAKKIEKCSKEREDDRMPPTH